MAMACNMAQQKGKQTLPHATIYLTAHSGWKAIPASCIAAICCFQNSCCFFRLRRLAILSHSSTRLVKGFLRCDRLLQGLAHRACNSALVFISTRNQLIVVGR
jgi:hypothetical protein